VVSTTVDQPLMNSVSVAELKLFAASPEYAAVMVWPPIWCWMYEVL
jgi:hypothetical protein